MFTLPEHLLPTASQIVMSCALVPGTELCSNVRMLGGKRIVLTCSFVCTEGAGSAIGSVPNSCFPLMSMAMWALVTSPPHPLLGVRFDEDAAKMTILGMVPLQLQQWAEQADVRALLPANACVLICGVVQMEPAVMA